MSKKKRPFYPPPALPRTGVESHAHLNSRQFAGDLPDVLKRAAEAGVAQLIQIFLHPDRWRNERALFDPYPWIFFLLGIHPTEAGQYSEEVAGAIRFAVDEDPRIRAIGEIGLDYYWKDCPPETQRTVFRAQLDLARERELPVVVHCREAEADTFALLEEGGFANYPLLWHCFGGDPAMARRIIDNGWHLSVPGPVTYPANGALRAAVAAVPLNRLLVETDCPYLAPAPLRGKRNEPAFLGYTIEAMANARGMGTAELWTACGDNARRFFGLPAI